MMRLLVALDDARSVTGAADLLGITTSAASQAIRNAERRLGRVLTERDGRGVRVTDDVTRLSARVRPILSAVDDLSAELDDTPQTAPRRVRIGSFASAATHYLPSLLGRIRTEADDVVVSVIEHEPAQLLDHLDRGIIDLAIIHRYAISGPAPRPHHIEHLVDQDPFRLVGSTRPSRAVNAAHLATTALLLPDPTTSCGVAVRAYLRELGIFDPIVRGVSADFPFLIQLAQAGIGAALVPTSTVPPTTRTRRLEKPLQRDIVVVARAARANDPIIRRALA